MDLKKPILSQVHAHTLIIIYIKQDITILTGIVHFTDLGVKMLRLMQATRHEVLIELLLKPLPVLKPQERKNPCFRIGVERCQVTYSTKPHFSNV